MGGGKRDGVDGDGVEATAKGPLGTLGDGKRDVWPVSGASGGCDRWEGKQGGTGYKGIKGSKIKRDAKSRPGGEGAWPEWMEGKWRWEGTELRDARSGKPGALRVRLTTGGGGDFSARSRGLTQAAAIFTGARISQAATALRHAQSGKS